MTCPCCYNRSKYQVVDTYEISSSRWTSSTCKQTAFFHSPRFCDKCGHIFNSTPPSAQHLYAYYKAKVPMAAEAYNTAKRISVIEGSGAGSRKKQLLDFGGGG